LQCHAILRHSELALEFCLVFLELLDTLLFRRLAGRRTRLGFPQRLSIVVRELAAPLLELTAVEAFTT